MVRYWRRSVNAWRRCRRSLTILGAVGWFVGTGLTRVTKGYCRFVHYIVVAQPIKQEPLLPRSRPTRIHIRRLERGDVALAQFPRTPETYEYRFNQGAIAYGAFDGDLGVGFIWFVFGPYCEDEVYCRFHPMAEEGAAWDFDVYVAPNYRWTSVFARLWDAGYAHMKNEGVRWTMSRISAFNPESIAAHRRLGAVDCGWVHFLCIGPLQLAIGNLAPRVNISWGNLGKPQYWVHVNPKCAEAGNEGE